MNVHTVPRPSPLDRWPVPPRPVVREVPASRTAAGPAVVDPAMMRDVLGRYATGVVVLTADDGQPVGMTCQSFASLSLDPPLVSLSPARTSTSWPRIRTARRFCVNVLAADQAELSDRFARSGGDKFSDVSWSRGPSGAPRLDGAVAWIEATVLDEFDGGDHTVVIASVTGLATSGVDEPLVFLRGRYGTVVDASGTMAGSDRQPSADPIGGLPVPSERDDRVDPILEFLQTRDTVASLDAKAVTMRLRRAAHWVDVQVARSLAPLGIELWELDVLATLSRLGGTAAIAQLQDVAQLTPGAITHRISKLEQNGFVTRAADPVDRRQVQVSLTRTGRARARSIVEANDRAQREALAGVDEAVLRRLSRDLRSFLVATEGGEG